MSWQITKLMSGWFLLLSLCRKYHVAFGAKKELGSAAISSEDRKIIQHDLKSLQILYKE